MKNNKPLTPLDSKYQYLLQVINLINDEEEDEIPQSELHLTNGDLVFQFFENEFERNCLLHRLRKDKFEVYIEMEKEDLIAVHISW